tara:strand:- start:1552 stop:2094 length:543 start_codon:yes stop_codon:yes gene_type:complete
MIRHHNYLNILVWCTLVIIPFLLQDVGVISTNDWSTQPANGLISILTGSFMHGSYAHMVGNLSGIIIGVSILYNFYYKHYGTVILLGVFVPSMISYFFTGIPTVGISGLVYTLIWFIIVRGLISRDKTRLFLAIGVAVIYGSSLKGAIPQGFGSNIAWQCHLAGVMTGTAIAVWARLKRN